MQITKLLKAGVAATAISAVLAPVVIAPVAHAQTTVSSIRGTVTDASGAPLSGATVTITDTRTGSSSSVTTSANGSYSVRNLGVGGPYSVAVSSSGYASERVDGVFVSLNGATRVNFDLSSGSSSGDEIVVTASRRNTQQLAIGPSSVFGQATITALPSISRDIRDIIRVDPRLTVSGGNDDVSCLGGSPRSTTFTLDGVAIADPFGLNSNGLPARNNFPVPFDSIQETAVEFAPYSVEYGNFTGCNINIVTKSGSNEFSGAAFAVFNNRGLTGSRADEFTVLGDETFRDFNWGASISGPIIKDRLFFQVTYEEIRDGGAIVGFGPEDVGTFANPVENLLESDLDQISAIAQNVFGVDTGPQAGVVPEESRRILTRWDWLITDNHRLEFTYSRERELEIGPDLAIGADFQFLNSFENEGSNNERYSARLFSQWTDNLSTEIRVSRLDNEDIQGPVGGGEAQSGNPIPRFIIGSSGRTDGNGDLLPFGNDDGVQAFGPGTFRSANELNTQIDQIKAKFDYINGNHIITGGYELNQLDVFNLFIPNATGTFVFNTIEDFENGIADNITLIATGSGDPADAAATFSRSIHSLYAQDEWTPWDALTLTFGLRYDFYTSDDRPQPSAAFVQRFGFSNDTGFESFNVLLPRFGFTYDAGRTLFGDTTFRGGVGVFSGGDPTVFFSNAFSNNGFGTAFAGQFGGGIPVLDGAGNFTGIPQSVLDSITESTAAGTGRVDAIDPDLEVPSVVRGSFGFSHFTDFGGAAGGFFDDWNISMDVIVTQNRNAFDFVDLTLTPTSQVLPDGRPVFNAVDPLLDGCDAFFVGIRQGFLGDDLTNGGPCDAGGDDQDILLTNVIGDDGGSVSFSTQFNKVFEYELFNRPASWSVNLGYAFSKNNAVVSSLSSTATSNFEEVATAIINNNVAAPNRFVNRHNVSFASTFTQELLPNLPTSLSVFVSAREGVPFSFAFDNNTPTTLFGDSDNEERNLFFVPSGPNDPLVQFGGNIDVDEFFAFLEESGLSEFGGQIAPRGAFRDPWFVDVDFRFQQDLPDGFERLRTLFFVDIENILNLIDSGSNVQRTFDRGDVGEAVPVLDAALSPDGTQFIFSNFPTGEIAGQGGFDRNAGASLWSVQFGLRFEF